VTLGKAISLTALLLLCSAMPALTLSPRWQHQGTPPMRQSAPPGAPRSSPPPNNGGSPQFHLNGPGPHRGDWLRQYMKLPPSQQERQLQQDPSFRSLPPDRQNHLLNRLRTFNSQSPEKKAQILNRMETFEHMTPQQQQAARNLFDRYRNLPDDQKNKISQAYRRLRGMPPSARNELLNSDEFRNNYTDDQRDLLRGMTDLNLSPTPTPAK
jgi:Protein of unknown function (DUF3106)